MADQDIIQQIRERMRESEEAESDIRRLALEDLRFANGDQWPEQQKRARAAEGRPCLVHDRIGPVIKQITNAQRQQKPAITVSPVGDGADVDTAEILQGLIRHIEYNSNADVAYDLATEQAVICGGPGWIRVITNYCDPTSFDQEIFIKPVKNHFSVYADPSCQELDYSDARYCIVVEDLTREQYKEQYPNSEVSTLMEYGTTGDVAPDWIKHDGVRIAEYWYVQSETKDLIKLANGQSATLDEIPEGAVVARDKSGKPITRKTEIKTVKWAITNGVEILEQGDWAGRYLPFVPVLGHETIIDGKRELSGIVRAAKDPCRYWNLMVSSQAESISIAPKTPYIGTKKQFEGLAEMWASSNHKNYPFLPYNADPQAPPPQRQQFEPAIQAISMAIAQADNDIKATTGIYDASLGAPGPEQSGRAILARQEQGSVATLHFSDNLGRALKHLFRVLIDLIPKIYDTQRVIRIIGDDEQQKAVMIGDPQAQQNWQLGMERIYDLSVGRYDVAVSMGASYASKRQDAVQSIMQLVQAFPPFLQMAGDILLKNMDIPGAQQLAKRAEKLLPPQVQDNAPQPPSPQVQALAQQHSQLVQQLAAATNVINTKKLELESKERIAAMQAWASLAQTEAKINSQAALQMIAQEKDRLMQLQGMSHEMGLQQMDAQIQQHNSAHDAAMQASDQAFEMQKRQALQQQQAQQQQQLHLVPKNPQQ